MSTYMQTTDGTEFDWWGFLHRSDATAKEWDEAVKLASDWVTCACGNQCAKVPRLDDGEPMDFALANLGIEFMGRIDSAARMFRRGCSLDVHWYMAQALLILEKIEKRSSELLREIEND